MLGEGYEKYLKDTQGEPMDKIKDYSKAIRYFHPSYTFKQYFPLSLKSLKFLMWSSMSNNKKLTTRFLKKF